MNKAEVISAVADKTGQSKSDAGSAVEAFMDVVQSELQGGGTVALIGFGNFYVKDRAARTGRNPRTGENIAIPASRSPGFKAGKAFKDALN